MWSAIEFEQGFKEFYPQVRRSLIRGADMISEQSGVSFSQALGKSFRQTIGRIFSTSSITPHTMLSGHIQATVDRCAADSGEWVVVAQDTVYYNYSGHKSMKGLGTIQGNVKGVVQHNVLAVNERGIPMGLIHQHNWTREGAYAPANESQKWEEGLQAVNAHLGQVAQSKKVVVVQDREADIFAFFTAHREPGVELVVRLFQNRKFETPETRTIAKLADTVRELPVLGTQQTQIRRQNRDINLTLRIQAAPIHVLPRKDLSAQLHKTKGLSLVVATEIAATDENGKDYFDQSKPAQWILLTSLQANELLEAARVVRCYSIRWAVERFHFACKSGALNVEKLQFDDIHTTLNALAFYSIIAWRILFLTLSVRQNPMQDPEAYFDPLEMKVLCTYDPQAGSSLGIAIRTLGKLVNFVPTKKQPYPGIKIMAEALRKLEDLTAFLRILNEKTLQD